MELAFFVYLISILENIQALCIALGMFSILLAVLLFIGKMDQDTFNSARTIKLWHLFACMFFAVMWFSIRALLPTEKQGYMIAGAYVTQRIAENKNVQEIGGKVLTLINQKLDQAIGKPVENK